MASKTLDHNAQGQITPDIYVPLINNAAAQYNVPDYILTGVFSQETNLGADIKTSSAGAVGATQFLPSTARQYGYPLTNNPTVAQLQQQFNSTAHYLSDLYKQYGDWNTAIQHYSGGGYGLAQVTAGSHRQVQANETQATGPNIDLSGVTNPLSSIASAISWLFQPSSWARILEILGAAAAIYFGLKSLTGAPGITDTVRKVTP